MQAKLIKSQYIKTYSAYKDLIENFKQYISNLDEVERSRDILKDPESIKNYLEVTLETRYYSDYNALMKARSQGIRAICFSEFCYLKKTVPLALPFLKITPKYPAKN